MSVGKSKGIIQGFVGGLSQGLADAGKIMFAKKLKDEEEEANSLRDRALQKDKQEFTSKENQLDRNSAENIANTKAKAASNKDGTTTNMKNAASLRAKGYPPEVADAVAQGAMKQIKDEETGDMILINTLTNKPVGRLTSGGTSGDKEWIPEGGQTENAPISKKNRDDAAAIADDKAGWFSTDATDFPETGSEKAFAKKEAQRLANEERAKGKGGIVNSAADAGSSTPQVATPAPEKPAPKAALDYLAKNPEALPLFIKKYGYDPTK